MKKLALLGAARPRYEDRIKKLLEKCGYCWSGWSYQINASMLHLLQQQFEKDGYFNIYWHDIEKPTEIKKYGYGSGYVEYRLYVRKKGENFIYEQNKIFPPNPECTPITDRLKPHRLYVKIFDKPIKISRRKWNTFTNFQTGKRLSGSYPFKIRDAKFRYIIDEEL